MLVHRLIADQIIEELLPKRDVYIYGKRYLFKWPENNSELDGLEKQRLIEYLNSIGVNWATEEANITNSSQILRVSPTDGVHHVNLFLRKDKGKEYCFVDMDDDRQDRLAVSKFYEIDRTSGLKKEQKAICQELRV